MPCSHKHKKCKSHCEPRCERPEPKCESPKCPKKCEGACKPDCDYDACKTSCECVPADLCIEKNLLNVCRVPLAALVEALNESNLPNNIPYAQLMLTYEIVLVNKGEKDICGLNISDTLAGIAFGNNLNNIQPFVSSVVVVKAPAHIKTLSAEEIVAKKGQLVDPCESYLPPCSVTKLVVNLVLSAPTGSICEIRYVRNTVTVEGKIFDCNKYKKIVPLFAKSPIWQTDSDVTLLINFNINV